MDNIFLCQILATLRNLMGNSPPLKIFLLMRIFFKISSLTILSNEIAIMVAIEYLNEAYDVGMIKFLKNGDFCLEKLRCSNFHIFGFYDFNGIPNRTIVIFDTFVYFSAKSTSNQVLEVETIPPDPLFSLRF